MAKTAADVMIECLMDWGVDTIFGLPGDGINGIMESLRTHQKQVRFIQVRHEEAAAFMACAWAKYTGKLGVCLATSGPGGIHLLNGLYDAKLDGQPVLAITGMHYHDLIGTLAQQDVELDKLYEDVAVFNQRVMSASQVALESCDTLLIVGSSFPYIEFLPKPGKARGVQIDLDPRRIRLRFPVEVGLAGDCRLTLEELLPMLRRNEDREFLEKMQKEM